MDSFGTVYTGVFAGCYSGYAIIGSGLVGEACFGILMKAVPQMNAFSIGIPIKMLLGFMVLMAIMPIFIDFTNTVFDQMYAGLDRMFAALTG